MAKNTIKTDEAAVAACGCGCCETIGHKAVTLDPATKDSNIKRLRRIEGQVRGLQKMVEQDRYCADIIVQISAVREALFTVGRSLMRNHLKYCAAKAITQRHVSRIRGDVHGTSRTHIQAFPLATLDVEGGHNDGN
jgi:CsoR family transcriptional regulator, copper-sensing transcriptional repressor